MNSENYDQITLQADLVGDGAAYLQPEMKVMLSVYEGNAVAIELPQKVVLEVVETEPVTKGQTASSSYKPAMLSNGVRTNVPPFIGAGTRIVVMTEDGSYVERAKDYLELVLPRPDLGEHLGGGLARKPDGGSDRRHIGAQERVGRLLLVDRRRDGPLAVGDLLGRLAPRAPSASALSGSMVCAKWMLASVYSWPQ